MFSYDYIKDIYDSLDGKGDRLKVHVKLDTGMSRLGFAVQNDEMRKKNCGRTFRAVNEFSDRLDFEGIFTHFCGVGRARTGFHGHSILSLYKNG